MPPLISLASYPNSRGKPRSASTDGNTQLVIVNGTGDAPLANIPNSGIVTANGNMLIVAANANRTALELRNTHLTSSMVYSYTDDVGIENNVNREKGFVLEAGESIRIDAVVTAIWGKSLDANRIEVALDIGEG